MCPPWLGKEEDFVGGYKENGEPNDGAGLELRHGEMNDEEEEMPF